MTLHPYVRAFLLGVAAVLTCGAAQAQDQDPPASPEAATLQARAAQAATLARTGQLKEAEAKYRELVLEAQRTLGAENPAALDLRIAEVRVLCVMGRYDEAEEKSRSLLRVMVRVLGPDQGATLLVWRTLGESLAGQGHFEAADTVYASIIGVLVKAHKEDHADMVRARIGRAEVRMKKGEYQEAAGELRAEIGPAERLLGPGYPETLALYAALATCLKETGNRREAIACLTHARDLALKKLGPDHMDTKKYQKALTELEGGGK